MPQRRGDIGRQGGDYRCNAAQNSVTGRKNAVFMFVERCPHEWDSARQENS